ncbi:MAG: GNAT family N-acyltransferase [Planctomycetota bacterium]|nr:GNAT family N-acyltransferase [Planctomycetota bacterium]
MPAHRSSDEVHFDNPGRNGLERACFAAIRPTLEWAIGMNALNRMYVDKVLKTDPDLPPGRRFLMGFDAGYLVSDEEVARIPKEGPLVIVANHPFGGLDAMILDDLVSRVRPDVRFIANGILGQVPAIKERFFPVDPFGGPSAPRRNAKSIRKAVEWLGDGGTLCVFPAGEVSASRWRKLRSTDPPWNPIVARLVKQAGATVLPVFFEGGNSPWFQAAGLVSPRLRTLLLGRELLRARNRRVRVAIGSPMPVQQLDRFADPADLTSYLRMRTYVLRSRLEREEPITSSRMRRILRGTPKGRSGQPVSMEPVPTVPADPPDRLAAEILALPPEQVLVRRGDQRVVYAEADQIPRSLREIGRLREISFRAAGEGTGRTSDLDRFDEWYYHLIHWNDASNEIVGAYRLGATDRIIPSRGIDGMYTRTLFHYDTGLLHELGPSLEMGRSFIRPEYQRRSEPLMLLWKGIGRFSGRFPRYRRLFGPVSISADYHATSTRLLLSFLDATKRISGLSKLVRPRRPLRGGQPRDWDPAAFGSIDSLDDIDELVREIERDERAVPVLVRQYLKLGGVFMGFNVDPEFSDVVDGLVLVDLLKMNRRLLRFYFGEDLAARFVAHHAEANARLVERSEVAG